MHSILEPEAHHQTLHRRMKDSFTPIYLTVLSVIQGVALADLALVSATGYKQFMLVQRLQVVITFAILIYMWDGYMQQSLLWKWVPDMRDAAIPFAIGAIELFLNHTIILSLSGWLFTFALLSGMGALANWHAVRQASKEGENAKMLSLLGRQTGNGIFIGWSVVLLLLAVTSYVISVEASEDIQGMLSLVLILLVVGGTLSIGLISMRNWSRIVTYARTGQVSSIWHVENLDE